MARQNHGPLSRAKGKLGGVVYQQYEGMQIAREYQPVVKNPQSEKQTENRAKFKNASQMLALFKEAITMRLAKASIYTRERRAIAVNILYRQAGITGDGSSQITFNDAVSALNAKTLTELSAPITTHATTNFSVTAPSGAVILGCIVGFDAEGNFKARKVVSATSEGTAVTFPDLADVSSQRAMFVYTLATTEDGRAIYENIYSDTADLFVDIVRLTANGDAQVSDIAGITV